MRTRPCSVLSTQAKWRKLRLLLGCLLAGTSLPLAGQSVDALTRAYRKEPTAQNRAALQTYLQTHNDATGSLVALVLGVAAIDQGHFEEALPQVREAEKTLPLIADYPAYLSAVALYELRRNPEVEHALRPVWERVPASPLRAKAVILAANSYIRDSKPKRAITLVEQHLADLTPSQAESLLAHAFEAAGQPDAAAQHFELLYLEYPLSRDSEDAEAAVARLRPPTKQARLARCLKLIDGSAYERARTELDALIPLLAGAPKDIASVKVGAIQYLQKSYADAFDYLSPLRIQSKEADAERLYYLLQCARHLDRSEEFTSILSQLARAHAQSLWRLQALLSAGEYYFYDNHANEYEQVYRACYASFPLEPLAADCHWRLAFAEYLARRPTARTLFESFLQQQAASDKVPNVLYFLGRLAEARADRSAAKDYYTACSTTYPNDYHAGLARARVEQRELREAGPSSEVKALLAQVRFPARPVGNFVVSPVTAWRVERARLLAAAGLDDLAESELRFGAKTDGQPQVMALELAEQASRRNAPGQAIRFIKQLAPDYLAMADGSAPERFWKLAFPLPFQAPLERYSREQGLDPYVVAALIRQESEFNPTVVSRAKAYGLTQVLPSTGRELSRRLGIRPFRAELLFNPEINLRIGTYFLRSLLDRLEGKWEAVLAAYNAGPGRVNRWLTWGDFREPAEFVEVIPFSETRNYVQIVLRNADIYRRLYAPAKQGPQPMKSPR